MSRVIAKITIEGYKYVALYCNTVDEIVSPVFSDPLEFNTWIDSSWPGDNKYHAYWVNDAKVWFDVGV